MSGGKGLDVCYAPEPAESPQKRDPVRECESLSLEGWRDRGTEEHISTSSGMVPSSVRGEDKDSPASPLRATRRLR